MRDSGAIAGLNPGGGNFGPDGRLYVGLRAARTITAFTPTLDGSGEPVLPSAVVPFPRGFAFGQDGTLFLASGIDPGGEGDNTILAFGPERRINSTAGACTISTRAPASRWFCSTAIPAWGFLYREFVEAAGCRRAGASSFRT